MEFFNFPRRADVASTLVTFIYLGHAPFPRKEEIQQQRQGSVEIISQHRRFLGHQTFGHGVTLGREESEEKRGIVSVAPGEGTDGELGNVWSTSARGGVDDRRPMTRETSAVCVSGKDEPRIERAQNNARGIPRDAIPFFFERHVLFERRRFVRFRAKRVAVAIKREMLKHDRLRRRYG